MGRINVTSRIFAGALVPNISQVVWHLGGCTTLPDMVRFSSFENLLCQVESFSFFDSCHMLKEAPKLW